jgi:outer membrane protein assembly factor BamA
MSAFDSDIVKTLTMKHVVVCILLFSSICIGQAQSSPQPRNPAVLPSYTLSSVSVTGSKVFAETDIVKASGLTVGSKVTGDDLTQAGNRLSQLGVFTTVSYRFDGRSATYVVVDTDQLVPATFENFIWFSDAELVQRVHNTVPLFAGAVPQTGTLADQVSAALDVMLKDKNVHGRVVAAPVPHAGPASSMQFRIDGMDVKLAKIDFPGAAPERVPLLQTATKNMLSSNYLQSLTPGGVKKRAQAVYGKLGFLKVQFDAPNLAIVKDDPTAPSIALQMPVQEGPQYTFAGADWAGNSAISSADLGKLIDLKPGAPADTSQLAESIAAAKDVYGTKGYMYAKVKSTATIDPEKQTAVFHLAIDEGPLYHMGKLELQNLDAQQAELVRKVWEMREGSVYDSNYAKTFLKKHPHELPSLVGWAALYTQTIHDDTQVVDLSLNFQKMQEAER